MKTYFALLAAAAALSLPVTAAEKKPDVSAVTIEADTLNKATAANLKRAGAEQVLKAAGAATKLGIVIETKPGEKVPPLVLVPTDPEWKELVDLAKKLAQGHYAAADKQLKDLGVTVTP